MATMRHTVCVSGDVRDTVRVRDSGHVPRPDSVHLVAGGIVAVMSSAMAAGKAEEGHGGHAGCSENHAENVEVHLYCK